MLSGGKRFKDRWGKSALSLEINSEYYARTHAGILLAEAVGSRKDSNAVVLALPRGGVPVAATVAAGLGAPLDAWLVRKLGLPGHEEVAMGAISVGGIKFLDHDLITAMGVSGSQIERVLQRETKELERRNIKYRDGRPPCNVKGKIVYLVDDGIATGATMRASIQSVRAYNPKEIIVVAPVGEHETCKMLETLADKVIVLLQPRDFQAVGLWYDDFPQTNDTEVVQLLKK